MKAAGNAGEFSAGTGITPPEIKTIPDIRVLKEGKLLLEAGRFRILGQSGTL